MPPSEPPLPVLAEDTPTPAFTPSPPSVPVAAPLTPTSTRKCEGCATPHPGTYGSGRFCSATCAKKVGARHKWAARASAPGSARRAAAARRARPEEPCESCGKLHDKSYGSGRFCSVHCARRVAATRKWEKSRSEKSKRLEAIRPAMLAPPPTSTPCALPVLTGKRRRVVGTHLEQLHISEPPAMYVNSAGYASVPQRLELARGMCNTPPPAAASPVLSVATPIGSGYMPTHPAPPPVPAVPYAQPVGQMPQTADVIMAAAHQQQVFYANQDAARMSAGLCYAYPNLPAYTVHGAAESPTYSTLSPSSSPSPTPCQMDRGVAYPGMHMMPRAVQGGYMFARGPAFDMDCANAAASPARIDEVAEVDADQRGPDLVAVQKMVTMGGKGDKPAIETSESAARALLCLRSNS